MTTRLHASKSPRTTTVAVFACVLALSSCKAFETNLQDTEVDYLATARQNFEAGDAAFKDGDYNDAIKFFEYVKNKYPYSKYAVLADLRTADAHYEREEWLQAADAYRLFVRYHPSHESVPYATYRIALAYYEETAKDPVADVWVIGPILTYISPIPKPEERDQTATKDAIQAFDEFIARYPDDTNIEDARALRQKAREKLASSDIAAAKYYAARDKPRGAMWRYQHVAQTYADTSLAASSLLRAARIALDELDEPETALPMLVRIETEHEKSDESVDAKKLRVIAEQRIAERAAKKQAEEAKADEAKKPDDDDDDDGSAKPE